jgi:glycosyltransferase involved in cell wall biosynthesis
MWWKTPSTWYAQQNEPGLFRRLSGARRTVAVRYLRPAREWQPRLSRRWRPRYEPGVTVVIVSYNSIDYLPFSVERIRDLSAPSSRILVVDNASRDGTREWLEQQQGLETILLDRNVGHGLAMNLGWIRSRTRYTVALDVDAFPISPDWLEQLIQPLEQGHRVSGAFQDRPWGFGRAFVHPCCLVMETARFFRRGHTFEEAYYWDTGELISWREYPALHLIGMTSLRGPGWLGQVFGQILYHNGYSTMPLRLETGEKGAHHVDGAAANIDGITRDEPLQAWREALEKYR